MGRKKLSFEWDSGNVIHLWNQHQVRTFEAEEAIKDPNSLIDPDELHSKEELRFTVVGRSRKHRMLFLAFTIRKGKIRVLHARDAKRKEVKLYEEEINIA